jgi:phenylalanyl-tRNA synthetase alpha chain
MAAEEPATDGGGGGDDFVNVLLGLVEKGGSISSTMEVAATHGVDHQDVVIKALKTLEAANFVTSKKVTYDVFEATEEGKGIVAAGKSPEKTLFDALTEEGVETAALQEALGKGVVGVGMGPNMKNKWAQKKGSLICRKADPASVKDTVYELLVALGKSAESVSKDDLAALAKRKLVSKKKATYFSVHKGPEFRPKFAKLRADLTAEMLASGEWKTEQLKAYNFNAMGAAVGGGYFHPLFKVRAEFKRILIGMGFEEMPTAKWVESSFWNFDALFQPQSHPARDAHDTFFIKDPAATLSVPEDYYERVKSVHQEGGYGSQGYRTVFKQEEAFKNLLRTHTTAISAQMLYKLANQEGGFTPKKYFSIDRVFRNETMDKTHLCEFHQVEGLVADYDLSLKDLIGTFNSFFAQLGITDLRFKPAFNPYTEPSMEIFGYHPGLGKIVEIGNSGIFRPEMLRPMGLPDNVRVIAWGLGLDRMTMIKYGMHNIRDLFGHQVDVQQTRNAPLARFP